MSREERSMQNVRRQLPSQRVLFTIGAIALSVMIYVIRSQSPGSKATDQKSGANSEQAANGKSLSCIHSVLLSDHADYIDLTVSNHAKTNAQWRRYDAYTGRELLREGLFRNQQIQFNQLRVCESTGLWCGTKLCCQLVVGLGHRLIWDDQLPGMRPSEELNGCVLCPESRQILIYSNQGSLWLVPYNREQIAPGLPLTLEEPCYAAKISPDGSCAALVTNSRKLLIWDLSSNQVVARCELGDHHRIDPSWSRDGLRIITCGNGTNVTVWNSQTGEALLKWEVMHQVYKAAALSSDGALAAVVDGDEIRIWDVNEGREQLPSLTGQEGNIAILQFDYDDRTLFSADHRGQVCRWSLTDRRHVWKTQVE